MPPDLNDTLVVGIAASALFHSGEADAFFQVQRASEPATALQVHRVPMLERWPGCSPAAGRRAKPDLAFPTHQRQCAGCCGLGCWGGYPLAAATDTSTNNANYTES